MMKPLIRPSVGECETEDEVLQEAVNFLRAFSEGEFHLHGNDVGLALTLRWCGYENEFNGPDLPGIIGAAVEWKKFVNKRLKRTETGLRDAQRKADKRNAKIIRRVMNRRT